MEASEFFELAAKEIFYQQGYVGDSVNKPRVFVKTRDTAEAEAGNLRLCLCETRNKKTLDLFLRESSQAKDLGVGLRANEHFVSQGCYFVETKVPVNWYLAATNEILPEH